MILGQHYDAAARSRASRRARYEAAPCPKVATPAAIPGCVGASAGATAMATSLICRPCLRTTNHLVRAVLCVFPKLAEESSTSASSVHLSKRILWKESPLKCFKTSLLFIGASKSIYKNEKRCRGRYTRLLYCVRVIGRRNLRKHGLALVLGSQLENAEPTSLATDRGA